MRYAYAQQQQLVATEAQHELRLAAYNLQALLVLPDAVSNAQQQQLTPTVANLISNSSCHKLLPNIPSDTPVVCLEGCSSAQQQQLIVSMSNFTSNNSSSLLQVATLAHP